MTTTQTRTKRPLQDTNNEDKKDFIFLLKEWVITSPIVAQCLGINPSTTNDIDADIRRFVNNLNEGETMYLNSSLQITPVDKTFPYDGLVQRHYKTYSMSVEKTRNGKYNITAPTIKLEYDTLSVDDRFWGSIKHEIMDNVWEDITNFNKTADYPDDCEIDINICINGYASGSVENLKSGIARIVRTGVEKAISKLNPQPSINTKDGCICLKVHNCVVIENNGFLKLKLSFSC